MKYLVSIIALCVTILLSGTEHRFYAVDADGDCSAKGIEYSISTELNGNVETVTLRLHNTRHVPFQPIKAGLRLGIDTYMDKYPDWYDKFFPTLAVCEADHFYGYMQSPGGRVKAVVSSDPIASWSLDYNLGYQDPAPHWFYGHRIESFNLDVLCRGPLPEHHPHLWTLEPGEERSWTVKIIDMDSLEDFEETVWKYTGAPSILLERTSCAPEDKLTVDVWGSAPEMKIEGEKIMLQRIAPDRWRGIYSASEPGFKNVEVTDGFRRAGAKIAVRIPWRETMRLARLAADRYRQKPTSHVESWYGFHTAFKTARFLPDRTIDSVLNRRFDMIVDKIFNRETGRPYKYEYRIQNVSSTIGMLADRYVAYGNQADLELGEKLADYLISCQRFDGAYMNGNTDYTSVIYPAKSLLDFADAERAAGREKEAKVMETSARRAIDRLAALDGNLETEGQLTYEDGMISCSALQLGELALRTSDSRTRQYYVDAMLKLLKGHDCLTQLKVADARRRGGTLRFWEAQYDIFMLPNMISSPHGWSAWRAYATYYAYLLTGEERWLRETFDAATAFASLINPENGDLNWAFVVDPFVQAVQVSEAEPSYTADDDSYGNPHPECYPRCQFVVGEQYVPMIANWQTIVSSDNDVHECFKFIAETVLCNAFVVERGDGSIASYNCRVERCGKKLQVFADEPQITCLYVNLRSPLSVFFDNGEIKTLGDYESMTGTGYVEPLDTSEVDRSAWKKSGKTLAFSWVSKDRHYRQFSNPPSTCCTDTTISVWRGERIGLEALVASRKNIGPVKVSLSDFTDVQGRKLSISVSEAKFMRYVWTNDVRACGYFDVDSIPAYTVADMIDLPGTSVEIPDNSVRPVWCSLEIPQDIAPGHYNVRLVLHNADNDRKLAEIKLGIDVSERTLPKAENYAFYLDLWQQPYAVSRYYDVPAWSDEHFKYMEPYADYLARAGQKAVTTVLFYEPWGEQSNDKFEPMVNTVREADGTWSFDFSIFDRYVEFMAAHGIDKAIDCFTMVPWEMSFRYIDRTSGKYDFVRAATSSEEYKELWTDMLRALATHLREKSWFEKAYIFMDERGLDQMMDALAVARAAVPDFKIGLAGVYHPELVNELDVYSLGRDSFFSEEELRNRRKKGFVSTKYTCCADPEPGQFSNNNPSDSAYLPVYATASGYDGYLHWSFMNWNDSPMTDTRWRMFGPGDTFFIYPDGRSSVRYERLLEGVQLSEKIRILRESMKADGDKNGLLELENALIPVRKVGMSNMVPSSTIINELSSRISLLSR